MDVSVTALLSGTAILTTILSLVLFGAGIYLLFLLIKALGLYIENNS